MKRGEGFQIFNCASLNDGLLFVLLFAAQKVTTEANKTQ